MQRLRPHVSLAALVCLLVCVPTVCVPTAVAQKKSAISYERHIIPILEKYCYDCHADGVKKGGLLLDAFDTEAKILKERKLWATVDYNVHNFVMPPPEKPQPTAAERELIHKYLDNLLFYCDCSNPDPGRVTIRRLNREEYNNTIRDLFLLDLRPADDFPDDDAGYGFDNIGDVLSLPPVLMERYLIAADKVLDRAIVTGPPSPVSRTFAPSLLSGGKRIDAKTRELKGKDEIYIEHRCDFAGGYVLKLTARGVKGGSQGVAVLLKIDGKSVREDVARGGTGSTFSGKTILEKGKHRFSVSSKGEGTLQIRDFEIIGPYDAKKVALPPSHKQIFIAEERDRPAAARIIRHFANRAFRRPVQAEEVNRMLQFFDTAMARGETFEMAIKIALKAVMVSPHFLFRMEWQRNPDNPKAVYPVTEYSLATRLAYFLWSSTPDNELLSLAFQKKLRANFRKQLARILKDPKADALAQNFAGQWLEVRNMHVVTPDTDRFPDFDKELRLAMIEETERLFRHIQRENRSILEFLTADYTFVNETLANHYKIPGVRGPEFRKVSLKHTRRRGVLTHASVLTVTSDPTRTSPVKRGKWVLENLLGTPPPPPPPNVPPLEEDRNAELKGTLRQRMEQHRNDPACFSCHNLMDPIGFGLENFDAIGAWRTDDGPHPVESEGRLNSGEKFHTPLQLNEILATSKKDRFVECLIRKMLTFALGRGLEYYDKCAVNEIKEKLEKDNYRFNTLILAIVESTPFQKRRGDGFVEPGR